MRFALFRGSGIDDRSPWLYGGSLLCCARQEWCAFCSADFGPLYKVMRGFTSCRSVASSLL